MAERKIKFIPGEFYHLYNRGNNRQDIFFCEEDYERFVKLMYLCNSTKPVNFREDIVEKGIDAWDFERGDQLVAIGAWVLMHNHYHIYVTIPKGNLLGEGQRHNNISKFMNKLGTAYSKYINTKYGRTGGLFEDTFKAVHVHDDNQAKYLFSYIHLNPVKLIEPSWKTTGIKDQEGAKNHLCKYRWSSYHDYMETRRPENIILNREVFPNYFLNKKDFENNLFDWLLPKR